MYSSGLRVSEAVHLHYDDISRTNMTIHVRETKGRIDRYTILSQRNLDLLTEYWFQCGRPKGILFPSSWTGEYMSVPSFNTRRWCSLISNPGKTNVGDCGGCMVSSGIISSRAAMAFSTAFSSVSLNVSMIILPTNLTPCHAVFLSHRTLHFHVNRLYFYSAVCGKSKQILNTLL